MNMIRTKEQLDELVKDVDGFWNTFFGGYNTDYGLELQEKVLKWVGEGYEEWLKELPCDYDKMEDKILLDIKTRFEEYRKGRIVQEV